MEKKKTLKGGSTRTLILEKARVIIAKDGFQAATFQRIANLCRIQQPAIFYYFKTKDDLLQSVIDDLIINSHRVVTEHTDQARDAHEKLLAHFKGTLHWATEFREESAVLGLLYYYSGFNSLFREKYSAILERARFRIQAIVVEAQHQKLMKDHLDPRACAHLLHDALLGGIVNVVATGCHPTEVARLKERWQVLFEGLFAPNLKVSTKGRSARGRPDKSDQ